MRESTKVVFFDLDHTLWDFERNSKATLEQLYAELELENKLNRPFEDFLMKYCEINDALWVKYRNGIIDAHLLRNSRFKLTFEHFGCRDGRLNKEMGSAYMEICPKKTALFPNTIEVLGELKRRYPLFLITNGFIETQQTKLKYSGLQSYFLEMISSESAGVKKPHPNIFRKALSIAKAKPEESVMIGDDQEADIAGASRVGMKTIFYNTKKQEPLVKPDAEIQGLSDLLKLL